MRKHTSLFSLVICAASVMMSACGGGGDVNHVTHGCSVQANALFFSLSLELDHSDSRNCLMDHGPAQPVSSFARVYDTYTTFPSIALAGSAFVTSWDNYSFPQFVGDFELMGGTSIHHFFWGNPRDPFSEEAFQWQSAGAHNYVSGDTPDYLEYSIVVLGELDRAMGVLIVDHTEGGMGF